ncbi:hypothetical protein Bsph_2475 [Lysinibacillus sphaericus C3-41]|uniref:Uncharacterized protein n=1 Tax=Lysinibacillus sphaericus (strain C3-41) TaxID=444177 RepID=B1HXQ3_LYSSC|nr:hypothetical protein Bsph_2475 [Lysinibacillus sphaericus C3-41]
MAHQHASIPEMKSKKPTKNGHPCWFLLLSIIFFFSQKQRRR